MSTERKYTEQEIAYIIGLKETDLTWEEITEKFNKKFGADVTASALTSMHHRYKHMLESKDSDYQVKLLKDAHRVKRNNSFTAKDYKEVLEKWNQRDDILAAISDAAAAVNKDLKKNPLKVRALPGTSSKKIGMTKELLLSDIHFGKLIETDDVVTGQKKVMFNLEILKKRLAEITDVTLKEIARDQAHYNVEKLIVALIGDIIESYTMHSLESAKGCEFGNSRQVYEAAKNLFVIVLRPLAETGIEIEVPAVCGNHDRTESDRTFNLPGEDNVTYIIYHTLKDFCELAGFKNVKFTIPTSPWAVVNIYGKNVLYEHGDNAKGPDRKSLENLMTTRSTQIKKPIEWLRVGHFHCPTQYGLYRIIVNGSLPGDDSYSLIKGFVSESTQTLNSYVNTKSRPSPFYKSLNIQLDHII
jgi:hypothetical protein